MNTKQLVKEDETIEKQLVAMADSHCHLDLIPDKNIIKNAIAYGVRTIITNGVDTKSNARNMELVDNRNIFAMIGIDPEHANVSDEELEFNIKMARQQSAKIVGIGEIGLDYGKAREIVPIHQQKKVFERFLDLANELKLPVTIHSREALKDVIEILSEKRVEAAHIHFFEGNVQQAKELEKKGYMISVPPLQSGKRSKVIKEMAIDNIMAESDAPAASESPKDVERAIQIIAAEKMIDFKRAADLLSQNTKRFFRLHTRGTFMRY